MLVKWTRNIAIKQKGLWPAPQGHPGCKTLQMWTARTSRPPHKCLLWRPRWTTPRKRRCLWWSGLWPWWGTVTPRRSMGLTERACRSPTRLTNANANSRAVFSESTLRLEDCNGSNGGPFRALSMVVISQSGTVRGRGGFILLAPLKNWITTLSLPTERTAIGAQKAATAAV